MLDTPSRSAPVEVSSASPLPRFQKLLHPKRETVAHWRNHEPENRTRRPPTFPQVVLIPKFDFPHRREFLRRKRSTERRKTPRHLKLIEQLSSEVIRTNILQPTEVRNQSGYICAGIRHDPSRRLTHSINLQTRRKVIGVPPRVKALTHIRIRPISQRTMVGQIYNQHSINVKIVAQSENLL